MTESIRMEDRRWWLEKRNHAHHNVARIGEALIERSRSRHELDLRHARLYGNCEILGLSPQLYSEANRHSARMKYNVIASVTDSIASKIAKNRPAPKFVPNGGDWSLHRRARILNKFGKGVLHASGAYRIRSQIFRDALVFGTGIAKVFHRDGEIHAERRFPWEILVDAQESVYGCPRTKMERRYIDKAVLLSMYGGKKGSPAWNAIEMAKPSDRDAPARDTLSEQLEVFEAYHLPSGKNAKDGRKIICIADYTFVDVPWTRDAFPYAEFHWVEPLAGVWGTGVAERLTPIQLEMNRLLRRIQEAHYMLGKPFVILDADSGIPETHIDNEVGTILVKNAGAVGEGINVFTPQTVHPETYAHLWTLEEKAYAQEGASMLYAQGNKAPGLNSGVAQRERNDTESERFVQAGQRWEQFHLDLVDLALEEARELGSSFSVTVPGRRWGEKINWGQVAMSRDSYNLQVWPVSILPQTPAARLEKAQELFAAGLLTADQLAEVLDLPDVEKAMGSIIAVAQWVEWAIDKMLDEREYIPPEPLGDLSMAIERVRTAYHEEMVQGAPEEVLDLLRDFITDAEALLNDAAQAGAAEAMPAAPAEIPAGVTAPPPPTELGAMMPMGSA